MNTTDFYLSKTSHREMAAGILKQAKNDLRRFSGGTSEVERELYLDAYRMGYFRRLDVAIFVRECLRAVGHDAGAAAQGADRRPVIRLIPLSNAPLRAHC